MPLKLPDKLKPFLGYFLIVLSVAPQIFFAIGKPEIAIPLQNLYQVITGGVPPGVVQAVAATVGSVSLRNMEPKPDGTVSQGTQIASLERRVKDIETV